jgi:hypothetical protein
MSLQFEQILEDVSYVTFQPLVNTTLGTSFVAGVQTTMPPSMVGIYPGAQILVGTPANQELVTVTSTEFVNFVATFANSHASTDPIYGATFPLGQTDAPLYYQSEMVGYLTEVQNDFLLKVQPLYEVTAAAISTGIRYYPQPASCIRLERLALSGVAAGGGYGVGPYGQFPYGGSAPANQVIMDLYETSQSSLDLSDPYWQTKQNPPQQWFRDETGGKFGVFPLPSGNYTGEMWYSVRAANLGNTIETILLVPDIFRQFMVFGVLARAYSKDGEMRDPNRARYFQKRYDLGIVMASKFMTGLGVRMSQGASRDPDFSPMPIPAAAKAGAR